MKTTMKALTLVACLSLGAYAARGSDTREVQADAVEKAAMEKLQRQGAEIEDAKKRLEAAVKAHQAESAAITSLIRAKHNLVAGEEFVGWTGSAFVVAFVGSSGR